MTPPTISSKHLINCQWRPFLTSVSSEWGFTDGPQNGVFDSGSNANSSNVNAVPPSSSSSTSSSSTPSSTPLSTPSPTPTPSNNTPAQSNDLALGDPQGDGSNGGSSPSLPLLPLQFLLSPHSLVLTGPMVPRRKYLLNASSSTTNFAPRFSPGTRRIMGAVRWTPPTTCLLRHQDGFSSLVVSILRSF